MHAQIIQRKIEKYTIELICVSGSKQIMHPVEQCTNNEDIKGKAHVTFLREVLP